MDHEHKTAGQPVSVVLPAPTAWPFPFVFAVGVALIFSGLLTNVWVSLLGFVSGYSVRWAGSARCFHTNITKRFPSYPKKPWRSYSRHLRLFISRWRLTSSGPGFVNPLLDEKIDWIWFTASQIAFGVVAGLVVVRHNKVWTSENLPLAVRAGLEAPGIMRSEDHEGPKP